MSVVQHKELMLLTQTNLKFRKEKKHYHSFRLQKIGDLSSKKDKMLHCHQAIYGPKSVSGGPPSAADAVSSSGVGWVGRVELVPSEIGRSHFAGEYSLRSSRDSCEMSTAICIPIFPTCLPRARFTRSMHKLSWHGEETMNQLLLRPRPPRRSTSCGTVLLFSTEMKDAPRKHVTLCGA